MNKYLEKVAAKNDKNKNSGGAAKRFGKSFVALAAGGVVGAAPASIMADYVGRKALRESKESADLGTIKKFMRSNNLHKDVTFNTRSHSLRREGLGQYQHDLQARDTPAFAKNPYGRRGVIAGVRKPGSKIANKDMIMHELGHAKDFQRHAGVKSFAAKLGRGPASSAAFQAATVGALANEKTRDYAPAIAAVPGALVLREEGAANYHAYKGIKAHKGGKAANQFLKKIVSKNMANYGLGVAAPVAAAYVGKKLMDKWSPRKGDKK